MTGIERLRAQFEAAEQKAQKIMAQKDADLARIRNKYRERLQRANQQTADVQKRLNDAEAVEQLKDRPDGEAVAKALGLELD